MLGIIQSFLIIHFYLLVVNWFAIPLRGTAQKEGASAATGRLKYNSQAEIVDVKEAFTGQPK